MTIGIHDSDTNDFPNLALMKISAYHKSIGDEVRWWIPIESYDRVYSSKVFTFTQEEPMLPPDTIKGGTGYGIYDELPKEIDDCFPDYSIYPNCDYAIGFITRGCIRNCPWCVVPRKEGKIRPYRRWQDIVRPDSNQLVLMDNNILACDYGIEQFDELSRTKYKIDCNQGLDARLITDDVAKVLAKCHWIRYIRMSCDTLQMLPVVETAIERLGKYDVKPYRIFVYVLVQDIADAEKRVLRLRELGTSPFAQPYRDFDNGITPTNEQTDFAMWVNRKQMLHKCESFDKFNRKTNTGGGIARAERLRSMGE